MSDIIFVVDWGFQSSGKSHLGLPICTLRVISDLGRFFNAVASANHRTQLIKLTHHDADAVAMTWRAWMRSCWATNGWIGERTTSNGVEERSETRLGGGTIYKYKSIEEIDYGWLGWLWNLWTPSLLQLQSMSKTNPGSAAGARGEATIKVGQWEQWEGTKADAALFIHSVWTMVGTLKLTMCKHSTATIVMKQRILGASWCRRPSTGQEKHRMNMSFPGTSWLGWYVWP